MSKSSAGFVKYIVLIVVAAIVIVGVIYLTSDVQRVKIKDVAQQYAKWTPENIAKDPVNYLTFCEEQATKALTDLKASEIRVAQSRGTIEGMLKSSSEKITLGEKALGELKDLYKQADAGKSWPVEWQGKKMTDEQVKQQIVSFHKQVEAQKTLKGKLETSLKKLDGQTTKIQTARSQVNDQIASIKTERESLKIQKITNEMTDRMNNIQAVLQTSISTASETSGTVTLDQLQADAGTVVDTAEFDKIMGK